MSRHWLADFSGKTREISSAIEREILSGTDDFKKRIPLDLRQQVLTQRNQS